MIAIVNGVIVTEQQFLYDHVVLIEDAVIKQIVHQADVQLDGVEVINANGVMCHQDLSIFIQIILKRLLARVPIQ